MFFRAADNSDSNSLASRMRRKRMEMLRQLIEDFPEPVRILDVGGNVGFWKKHLEILHRQCHITALNLDITNGASGPDIVQVQGDARSMPQYGDQSFDLCFSNSVIEHVGTLYDQMAMAREIRCVGKSYFLQTPNRYFPLEAHFLLPLWQFYPKTLRRLLYTRFTLGWMKRQPDPLLALAEIEQVRLLIHEIRRLFPDAEIRREKIGPLTKSIIAIRRPNGAAAHAGTVGRL
ncbi:MAG TPA: methyltransferase domain-containing protein [Verrucomicrobiae bacterium]|nr:methyltransferase domain-containing protein [Verrucomicrobiae bacterium]